MTKHINNVIIFGGCGYIGSFFAANLIKNTQVKKIWFVDINIDKEPIWPKALKRAISDCRVKIIFHDIRRKIDGCRLPSPIDLICNFAAIHREPGHLDWEYFDTNIRGAENVCEFAEKIGCNNIIFTSSIATYGKHNTAVNENTLTVPDSAYGSSKLVAETIHKGWLNKDTNNRYLSIVRPGVIYGPGEDGNVRRMIRAIRRRIYFYTNNHNIHKAGGYIKELTNAMNWVLEKQIEQKMNLAVYNFTASPTPTMQDYIENVCRIIDKPYPRLNVPFLLPYIASHVIQKSIPNERVKRVFDPVRINKLKTDNNIQADFLIENGYEFKYDLLSSFKDWYNDAPEDWV